MTHTGTSGSKLTRLTMLWLQELQCWCAVAREIEEMKKIKATLQRGLIYIGVVGCRQQHQHKSLKLITHRLSLVTTMQRRLQRKTIATQIEI